jgi:hypothetical protein
MDTYKLVMSKLFSICGVMYTAVTWWDLIQSVGDVLYVWCTTYKVELRKRYFFNFTLYIVVILSDDGWNCQPKHIAYVRNI